MKIKNYFVLALMAAMAFTACNKDENGAAGTDDNSQKSVTLSLKNVKSGTRSADLPIANQTKVTLGDFQVFFAKGDGTLVNGKTLQNQDAQHYFGAKTDFDAETRDKVFHFLPSDVKKVIVVGNYGRQISATNESDLERELAIADEQKDEKLALYDVVELKTLVGEETDTGHPLYKADIVLEPRVSRIEVVGFTYNIAQDGKRDYTSIDVEQIVLNNYYGAAQFVSGTILGTKVADNVTPDFFSNAAAANAWYSDMFDDTDLPAIKLTTDNPSMTFGTAACPAYHFFPMGLAVEAGKNVVALQDIPQLVVKLIGTDANGGAAPLYLKTSRFTRDGEAAVTNEVAKIYKVTFAFDDDDLTRPEKCVEVNVETVAWNVVDVITEF